MYSQTEQQVRSAILENIAKVLGKQYVETEWQITYPPENVAADFAIPCFAAAKSQKTSPAELAQKIAPQLATTELIASIEAAGPYININLNQGGYAKAVLQEIGKAKEKYGHSKIGKGRRIMLEYFSPNTNKPLTIGHLRNITLGWSLSRLYEATGHKVIETTIFNDRGIAIAKAMVAYQKWGENKTPKTENLKPDHFVGHYYVLFGKKAEEDPALEEEAKKMLQRWEQGDKEVTALWQKMQRWVLEGFTQTLKELGDISFDEKYFESEIYQNGRELVDAGLKKGVFNRGEDDVVYAPLEKFNIPDKVVLRSDGTSVYITQDLYLASLKAKHKLDQSIYVVGSEQDMYLKQLFKIVELLHLPGAGELQHLSYGMIRLPDGKIKSRQGLIEGTGADDVLDHLIELAQEEIAQRDPALGKKELAQRAKDIALGALKFYILQVDPKTTMVFEPKQSIAFVGRTGPYLQYVNTRISGIFEKTKVKPATRISEQLLADEHSFALVKMLARYPGVIAQATERMAPSVLADYLYELAKTFSAFYEHVPVIQAETKEQAQRLALLQRVQVVFGSGLGLLGIPTPEKM